MQKKQRDRMVAKALLLSAGMLAIPTGVLLADGAGMETSPAALPEEPAGDAYESEQVVDDRMEEGGADEAQSLEAGVSVEPESAETFVAGKIRAAKAVESETEDPSPAAEEPSLADRTYPWTISELLEAGGLEDVREATESEAEGESEEAHKQAGTSEAGLKVLDTLKTPSDETKKAGEADQNELTPEERKALAEALKDAENAEEKEAVKAKAVVTVAPPKAVSAEAVSKGLFYDASGKVIANRWVAYQGDYYFPNADGVSYVSRFITFGPKISYYMDASGRMQRGVISIGEKKYLLDESTAILHKDNAWVVQSTGRYFPNAQGELYHDQFITFGAGNAHYMLSDGREASGVTQVGKKMYLLDKNRDNRLRMDNAWVHYEGKDYFPNAKGELYHDQFITFGKDGAFYMGSDASKQTGLIAVGTKTYLLDHNGKLQKELQPGFQKINGNLVYVNPKTHTVEKKAQWVLVGGKAYFQNEEGILYTNRNISFGPEVNYYMGADGATTPGLHEVGGKLYFYDPALGNKRRLAQGEITWQGKKYYIGKDGSVTRNELIVVDKEPTKADSTGALSETDRCLVIDISTFQEPSDIDYDAISKQVKGVILRAGYTGWGTGCDYYKDEDFERHYKEFNARHIPMGAYWYSCADTPEEGRAEAKEFLKLVQGKKFLLPLYWDTEDEHHQRPASKQQLTDTGKAFLSTLEANGYYAGIYGSTSWLNTELDMNQLDDYDVWVAHYGVAQPSYKGNYNMWQFTSSYHLSGYKGNLDANWMYKDYPTIIKSNGLNHL